MIGVYRGSIISGDLPTSGVGLIGYLANAEHHLPTPQVKALGHELRDSGHPIDADVARIGIGLRCKL